MQCGETTPSARAGQCGLRSVHQRLAIAQLRFCAWSVMAAAKPGVRCSSRSGCGGLSSGAFSSAGVENGTALRLVGAPRLHSAVNRRHFSSARAPYAFSADNRDSNASALPRSMRRQRLARRRTGDWSRVNIPDLAARCNSRVLGDAMTSTALLNVWLKVNSVTQPLTNTDRMTHYSFTGLVRKHRRCRRTTAVVGRELLVGDLPLVQSVDRRRCGCCRTVSPCGSVPGGHR